MCVKLTSIVIETKVTPLKISAEVGEVELYKLGRCWWLSEQTSGVGNTQACGEKIRKAVDEVLSVLSTVFRFWEELRC